MTDLEDEEGKKADRDKYWGFQLFMGGRSLAGEPGKGGRERGNCAPKAPREAGIKGEGEGKIRWADGRGEPEWGREENCVEGPRAGTGEKGREGKIAARDLAGSQEKGEERRNCAPKARGELG
ncbi:hypothetical protein CYMTET_25196 [Cymbomonas tetramitiformis]|uniref:Uncharacterized protein n=1 Tax=Cymbomonas tetramitiformis TaxID=36881 RepID=A0AAE0FV19_9CHLO|nr:hypothetical protein CYMTET_25196 [Cymbomonas tetramitiformis]